MPIGDSRIAGWWRLLPSYHDEHVGYRYLVATRHDDDLTLRQRARLQDEFAAEFDQLPPSREPTEGWAKTMAGLCRDIARHLRERAKTEDPTADPARENRLPPIRIY